MRRTCESCPIVPQCPGTYIVLKVDALVAEREVTPQLLRGLERDCVRVVQETISKLGGLDIIVSNAVRELPPQIDYRLTPGRATHVSQTSGI